MGMACSFVVFLTALEVASVRSANPARKGCMFNNLPTVPIEFPFIFMNAIETLPFWLSGILSQ